MEHQPEAGPGRERPTRQEAQRQGRRRSRHREYQPAPSMAGPATSNPLGGLTTSSSLFSSLKVASNAPPTQPITLVSKATGQTVNPSVMNAGGGGPNLSPAPSPATTAAIPGGAEPGSSTKGSCIAVSTEDNRPCIIATEFSVQQAQQAGYQVLNDSSAEGGHLLLKGGNVYDITGKFLYSQNPNISSNTGGTAPSKLAYYAAAPAAERNNTRPRHQWITKHSKAGSGKFAAGQYHRRKRQSACVWHTVGGVNYTTSQGYEGDNIDGVSAAIRPGFGRFPRTA